MKRRAVFGQWKTPPQVMYPSGGQPGLKKSVSMPMIASDGHNAYPHGGSPQHHQQQHQQHNGWRQDQQPGLHRGEGSRADSGGGGGGGGGGAQGGNIRRATSYNNVGPMGRWPKEIHEDYGSGSGSRTPNGDTDMSSSTMLGTAPPMHSHGNGMGRRTHGDGNSNSSNSMSMNAGSSNSENSVVGKRTASAGGLHHQGGLAGGAGAGRGSARMQSLKGAGSANSLTATSSDSEKPIANSGSTSNLSATMGEAGVGTMEDDEEKRSKRLARNRASARMRRLRKKTIVETLELECEQLSQTTAKIKHWLRDGHFLTADPALVRPLMDEQGGTRTSPTEVTAKALREQLVAVLGGQKEAHTISMARRRAGMQLLVDRQVALARALEEDTLVNSGLSALTLEPTSAKATAVRGQDRAATHARMQDGYKRAMTFQLASHLPVTEQEFAERNKRPNPGTGAGSGSVGVMSMGIMPGGSIPSEAPLRGSDAAVGGCGGGGSSSGGRVSHASRRLGLAVPMASSSQSGGGASAAANSNMMINSAAEIAEMRRELRDVLQLSDDQQRHVTQVTTGLDKEAVKAQALARVCVAVASHDWFEFPCLEQTVSQFRGVLTATQMNKFLVWSQRNGEAIKALPIAVADTRHTHQHQHQQQQHHPQQQPQLQQHVQAAKASLPHNIPSSSVGVGIGPAGVQAYSVPGR